MFNQTHIPPLLNSILFMYIYIYIYIYIVCACVCVVKKNRQGMHDVFSKIFLVYEQKS